MYRGSRMESCSVFNERIRSISCDNNNQNLWCNLIVVLFEAIKIMRCTVYTRFSRTQFYVPCLVLTNDNKYGIQCDNRNLNFTIETFYHRIVTGMYIWRKHALIWTSHKMINSVNNSQWNEFYSTVSFQLQLYHIKTMFFFKFYTLNGSES